MTLRLLWRTTDPDGTAMRLASVVGGRVDGRTGVGRPGPQRELVVPLLGGDVVVVPDAAGPDRLALDGPPSPSDPEPSPALRGTPRLLGLGWATVDADRAIPEVAAALGLAPRAFEPAVADECLGASARVGRLGPLTVVVLEPATEGRVAAALARSGEGPCAIYVRSSSSATALAGPLGRTWLAMADRRWGPFVLAVGPPTGRTADARGTIDR